MYNVVKFSDDSYGTIDIFENGRLQINSVDDI